MSYAWDSFLRRWLWLVYLHIRQISWGWDHDKTSCRGLCVGRFLSGKIGKQKNAKCHFNWEISDMISDVLEFLSALKPYTVVMNNTNTIFFVRCGVKHFLWTICFWKRTKTILWTYHPRIHLCIVLFWVSTSCLLPFIGTTCITRNNFFIIYMFLNEKTTSYK